MKNKFKQFIALAVIAIASASVTSATAADPTFAAQALTMPVVPDATTTNGLALIIDCRKQQNVAIQWKVSGAALGTGTNVTMKVGASVDGISFSTNQFSLAVNATTAPNNTLVTNINCAGFGYLRIDAITTSGVAATSTLKYGVKISSP